MSMTGAGEPGWVQDVIWWHVYPLGFVGAERSAAPEQPVVHRLGHLVGWLDHAVELGASGLALGPVFASETHGYDTTDHFRIDPRLGDDADLDALVPYTFLGNHDVTRIASRLRDERHLAHALVVLLTTGGTPAVYTGDEHAFRGVKEDRAGGDDAVRPSFPATPGELSPLGLPTYSLHQELIGLRRRHRWLHTARTTTLHLANEQLVYETRAEDERVDGGRLVVALSVGEAEVELPAPGAGAVLAGEASVAGGRVRLPASGWAVLAG
jgi:cyclomaltodextrinase